MREAATWELQSELQSQLEYCITEKSLPEESRFYLSDKRPFVIIYNKFNQIPFEDDKYVL